MNKTLIVPAAADKPEYDNSLPYVFASGEDGVVICIKSILGLPLGRFDKICFTILRKHDERFFVADSLKMQCRRLGLRNVKVVILDEPTMDQVDTVYSTIRRERIEGSIYIKDADSYFETDEPLQNGVAIFPIEELDMLDPRDKSYVAVDDMYYITNIIEKNIIGHYISAGGYAFEDSDDFCRYCVRLRRHPHLYLSHVIYAMLLDGHTFRPSLVNNYRDWGTKRMLYIR